MPDGESSGLTSIRKQEAIRKIPLAPGNYVKIDFRFGIESGRKHSQNFRSVLHHKIKREGWVFEGEYSAPCLSARERPSTE